MRQLLVATTNRGKVREIRPLLAGVPFGLVTLADFAPTSAPEETGSTFAENARNRSSFAGESKPADTDLIAKDIDALNLAIRVAPALIAEENAVDPYYEIESEPTLTPEEGRAAVYQKAFVLLRRCIAAASRNPRLDAAAREELIKAAVNWQALLIAWR